MKVGIWTTSYNLPSLSVIQHKLKKCFKQDSDMFYTPRGLDQNILTITELLY